MPNLMRHGLSSTSSGSNGPPVDTWDWLGGIGGRGRGRKNQEAWTRRLLEEEHPLGWTTPSIS